MRPSIARGPAVELTTPTGAAVAATLANSFGVLPPMTVTRIGYGAGGHDFPEQANVLRVILGEPTGADEALAVWVMEANIDDLNPQVLAYAAERLLEAGALDVALQPVVMKKGRPGTCCTSSPGRKSVKRSPSLSRRNHHSRAARLSGGAARAVAHLHRSGNAARKSAHEGLQRRLLRAGIRGLPQTGARIQRAVETD